MLKKMQSRLRLKSERALRQAMRLAFGFDRWHISTLQERQYAQDIIIYLNGRAGNQGQTMVEIGCGVGDILRHARYQERVGLDTDLGALRAARFLTCLLLQGSVRYSEFRFPDQSLHGVFDVIVMVNWIHHIAPEVLSAHLSMYLTEQLRPGGEIIIDTVQDPAYRFRHSIAKLTEGLDADVHHVGSYARQRDVYAIRVRGPALN